MLPPSCVPAKHCADDLCALLLQLRIREKEPVDWAPRCSAAARRTVGAAVARLALRAQARLCRKGRLAYDPALRDAEYDVDAAREVARLVGLLDDAVAAAGAADGAAEPAGYFCPGRLLGLHRAVRRAWESPAHQVTLLSGEKVAVLGDRFDALASAASVHGFTDALARAWRRTLEAVVVDDPVPTEVLEELYRFAPQGLPFRPRRAASLLVEAAPENAAAGAPPSSSSSSSFAKVFAAFSAQCDEERAEKIKAQQQMQTLQADGGKENVHSNLSHRRTATDKKTPNNLDAKKNKTKQNKKKKPAATAAAAAAAQNRRGVDNCYHCLRNHAGKVVFVFEDGDASRKEAFACEPCWCRVSKRRVDDDSASDSESSSSEYEY
jgi:hypothetical protein